jgi:hypothetical protein
MSRDKQEKMHRTTPMASCRILNCKSDCIGPFKHESSTSAVQGQTTQAHGDKQKAHGDRQKAHGDRHRPGGPKQPLPGSLGPGLLRLLKRPGGPTQVYLPTETASPGNSLDENHLDHYPGVCADHLGDVDLDDLGGKRQ